MSDLERTRQYLNEAFQSGAITCLICIASVKRTQAVRDTHTHERHILTCSGVNTLPLLALFPLRCGAVLVVIVSSTSHVFRSGLKILSSSSPQ